MTLGKVPKRSLEPSTSSTSDEEGHDAGPTDTRRGKKAKMVVAGVETVDKTSDNRKKKKIDRKYKPLVCYGVKMLPLQDRCPGHAGLAGAESIPELVAPDLDPAKVIIKVRSIADIRKFLPPCLSTPALAPENRFKFAFLSGAIGAGSDGKASDAEAALLNAIKTKLGPWRCDMVSLCSYLLESLLSRVGGTTQGSCSARLDQGQGSRCSSLAGQASKFQYPDVVSWLTGQGS